MKPGETVACSATGGARSSQYASNSFASYSWMARKELGVSGHGIGYSALCIDEKDGCALFEIARGVLTCVCDADEDRDTGGRSGQYRE